MGIALIVPRFVQMVPVSGTKIVALVLVTVALVLELVLARWDANSGTINNQFVIVSVAVVIGERLRVVNNIFN